MAKLFEIANVHAKRGKSSDDRRIEVEAEQEWLKEEHLQRELGEDEGGGVEEVGGYIHVLNHNCVSLDLSLKLLK
jgi:hypothetical protein